VPRSTPIGREWTVYFVYSQTRHDDLDRRRGTFVEVIEPVCDER